MNNGYQRSLTLKVIMKINDVSLPGYPHEYHGRNSFTQGEITYPAITADYMAVMDIEDFETRLAAFKAYVEQIEFNLDVDSDIISGTEARKKNLTACPIV